ncbi:restriction endonuclease [uncultured Algibacter sp.]|uniref:restriction endonuclease n=1 Tax=uncultured Algibacter sp. TaxID=298659 RepID=UPI0032173CCD
MLNFKELSLDGNQLELLVREILLTKGYRVQWSGKGPDGGKDLICWEHRDSEFINDTKKWLIQCKHNAHSGKAVGIKDLDDITDSCSHHDVQGYLLVCGTYPSSKVVERLEGITNNQKNNIEAIYWILLKLNKFYQHLNCGKLLKHSFLNLVKIHLGRFTQPTIQINGLLITEVIISIYQIELVQK